MENNICVRCNCSFSTKSNLRTHLRKKKDLCEALYSDKTVEEILEDISAQTKYPKILECQYCDKKYTCKTSLNRHVKKCRDKTKTLEKIKVILENIEKCKTSNKIL